MRSVNKVILMGNVGNKPNIITTQSGSLVANLSLATSFKMAAKDGREAREITEWHRLIGFGRTAEIIRDYVGKGTPLYVEGQLQTRSWEKDGEKRYATEIVIRELSMLGTKQDQKKQRDPIDEATAQAAGVDQTQITDEDIPF